MYIYICIDIYVLTREKSVENLSSIDAAPGEIDKILICKGMYSIEMKKLIEDCMTLNTACNLFKDYVVVPETVLNYPDQKLETALIMEVDSEDDSDIEDIF